MVLVTLGSSVWAGFESYKSDELAQRVRIENWFYHHQMENVSARIQTIETKYLETHKDNLDIEIIRSLGRTDADAQSLYLDAIRRVQLTEPSFTAKDFQRWFSEGKLTANGVRVFQSFALNAKQPESLIVTYPENKK